MAWTIGVDEAGRGPAIGSMFATAVAVVDASILPDDVADSKTLSPTRRERIAETLRADDRVAISVAEITSQKIDDPSVDMNTLTVDAHARALTPILNSAVATEVVVLDACDVDASRFADRVIGRLPREITVTAEHKADQRYPAVAAASIVAKVERDEHVSRLAREYGLIGSGYPTDPETRKFLKAYVTEHGMLPSCARRSWKTCKDVLAAVEQAQLGNY